jgi:glucan phosphoethanolaminetransferase (alkaline phosphatase superfamily)
MQHKSLYTICFLVILCLWVIGGQEIYLNRSILTDVPATRYALYFLWILFTGFIGFIPWYKYPKKWIGQLWIGIYSIALVFLSFTAIIDLFIFHFTRSQKNYIQSFRLFFQSPVPMVILYLIVKISGQLQRTLLLKTTTN